MYILMTVDDAVAMEFKAGNHINIEMEFSVILGLHNLLKLAWEVAEGNLPYILL